MKYMQLWEEKAYIREGARAEGLAEGCARGIEVLIHDNLEEGKGGKTIIEKLVRHFSLTEEKANNYFEKYKRS